MTKILNQKLNHYGIRRVANKLFSPIFKIDCIILAYMVLIPVFQFPIRGSTLGVLLFSY